MLAEFPLFFVRGGHLSGVFSGAPPYRFEIRTFALRTTILSQERARRSHQTIFLNLKLEFAVLLQRFIFSRSARFDSWRQNIDGRKEKLNKVMLPPFKITFTGRNNFSIKVKLNKNSVLLRAHLSPS